MDPRYQSGQCQARLQGPAFTAIEENRLYRCIEEAEFDLTGEVGVAYQNIHKQPARQTDNLIRIVSHSLLSG